jgi:4-hydroxythreonine-4-phosphate dehydrogenase
MEKNLKPVIAVTPGDPCGIGPEIVIKSLNDHPEVYDICRPVVIGDPGVLRNICRTLGKKDIIRVPDRITGAGNDPKRIDCVDIRLNTGIPGFGKVSADGGRHAFASIEKSIELALDRQVQAVATAPINKEALKLAGVPYLDHTEILTKLTRSMNTMTLFVTGTLRVFFYSRHILFKDIPASLNQTDILHSIKMSLKYLQKIGIASPSLALAALNPHGGEQGMFGQEEIDILIPAVQEAQQLKLDVSGPVPADSVFHLAKEGHYDGVLSLYHDQGHIATKTLDFHRTVSLTMGLPFLRTSVDHGTAFDIAGKGIASEISLVEAIKAAAKYGW